MPNEKPGCLGFILQAFGLLPKEVINETLPYAVRDDFLSESELSFYKVLQQALKGKAVVCPKVGLGDVFFITTYEKSKHASYSNKINKKHVDFLVCSIEDLKPLYGIELDDTSHQRQDRIDRDRFVNKVFESAGLALIRFENKRSYSIAQIEENINGFLETKRTKLESIQENKVPQAETTKSTGEKAPICSKCGIPMVLRTAKKGENRGYHFYGCANYPKCRETVQL